MSYVTEWALAFALTSVFEVPIVLWLMPRSRLGRGRRLLLAGFASLLSHPAVWFIWPAILGPNAPYARYFVLAELWALASESVYFACVWPRVSVRRAFAVSLVANAFSASVGSMIYARLYLALAL